MQDPPDIFKPEPFWDDRPGERIPREPGHDDDLVRDFWDEGGGSKELPPKDIPMHILVIAVITVGAFALWL